MIKGKLSAKKIVTYIGIGIGGLALIAGMALLFGFVVMLLWNWLMPTIFNLPTITYFQAWGLVLLSHILFKSSGGSKDNHSGDSCKKNKKKGFKEEFKAEFKKEFEKECGDEWRAEWKKGVTDEIKKHRDDNSEENEENESDNTDTE